MTDTKATTKLSARERARQAKERLEAQSLSLKLPTAGIIAHYPGFVHHETIVKAQKLAGTDRSRTDVILIQMLCRFGEDREQWTTTDIEELLVVPDIAALSNALLSERDASGKSSAG